MFYKDKRVKLSITFFITFTSWGQNLVGNSPKELKYYVIILTDKLDQVIENIFGCTKFEDYIIQNFTLS